MADPLAQAIPLRVRRPLFLDGLASRLMDTFTGGPFLAGLALLLGASNVELGLLASLPFLAQAAQLPTLALLLRVRDRRATVVWAAGAARTLLAAIALLLWLHPSLVGPGLLIAILAVNAFLVVAATAAWSWWMRDTLPADRLGAFFGHRMRWTTAAALVALLLAGTMLDAFKAAGAETRGYALLFTLGTFAGVGGLVALRLIPHAPAPHTPSPESRHVVRSLRAALRRPETSTALWSLSLVSVSLSFALPFVAVFLLRSLGYSYAVVTGLAVVSQLGYLAGLRGWGHLSDRHGERGVLFASLALLAAVQFAWGLTGWSAHGFVPTVGGTALLAWLGTLHFASGYAVGGAELGGTNLMLKSAPAEQAQAHLAAIGLGKAVVAGLGTVAAGLLWQAIGSEDLLPLASGWGLRGFQVLSLFAAFLTLGSMAMALRIRETAPVPVSEVARTMRREVGQMSSIAGIRGFIHALSYSVEFLAGPFEGRKRRDRARTPQAPPVPPPPAAKP
ncbi:MAG: hypothetical protein ABR562_05175 [Thermoplasmatota archaeon]|nr:MFS transporter [Halobacteriales archaeon]